MLPPVRRWRPTYLRSPRPPFAPEGRCDLGENQNLGQAFDRHSKHPRLVRLGITPLDRRILTPAPISQGAYVRRQHSRVSQAEAKGGHGDLRHKVGGWSVARPAWGWPGMSLARSLAVKLAVNRAG